MWLEKLKEIKKEKGLSSKTIANLAKLPERTVIRIFSGETDNPYLDTIHRIATAMDCSLDEILTDTKAVIASESLVEVKESLAEAQESTVVAEAERDLISIENEKLKIEIDTLKTDNASKETRIKLLELELKYKEELLKLHDIYNKILSRERM